MQLMISIVERGKGLVLIEHYKKFNVFQHTQSFGHGTAASHLMDTLGFGTTERDVLFSLAPQDTMRQLMYHLKDEDRSKLGARGIACTINLTGMTAVMAVALSRLEAMDPEKGETLMDKGNRHSLILITVNHGYTDAVMETARALGARGGTVIRARWTEGREIEKLANITLQAEKEVLAIVCDNREREVIMNEVSRVHGLQSPAQAALISVPIDHTARLD